MSVYQSFVVFTIGLIPLIISTIAFFSMTFDFFSSFFDPDFQKITYDFIIVGGGSAGAVLASRLSEDPSVTVLLIEAGGAPSFLSGIPSLTSHIQLSPYDWQYETVPQENACLGMVDQKSKWPRGKMLGGTSGLNYMLYVRGNKADFDGWQQLGNAGWGFDDVLLYFIKSECQTGRYKSDSKFHGQDGPLSVSDSIYVSPLANLYGKMAQKFGFAVQDINGDNQTGFDIPQVHLDQYGRRADTYRSFLRGSVEERENLYIMKHSHVSKIIFNDDQKTAKGVEVIQFSRTFQVSCKKEVILSAGSIGSPQILMLSGVGPKDHLEELKIPVVLEQNNVGQHLQDHVTTMLGPFFVNESITFDIVRFFTPAVMWEYFTQGTGPLAATVACDSIGFLSHVRGHHQESVPQFQYHINNVPIYSDYGTHFRHTFGIKKEIWDDFLIQYYGRDGVTILPVILHPKSRGFIQLKSSNPMDHPIIDPKYFSHPQDVKDLVRSIRIITEMFQSSDELSHYDFSLPDEPFPNCRKEFEFRPYSDDYWSCYVKHLTLTMYHPVGTCRMGPDPTSSVVDPELRVHGLTNVRIIDASIMPEIVSGNTNAAVIMIAEKGSDLIKESWKVESIKSGKKEKAKDEL